MDLNIQLDEQVKKLLELIQQMRKVDIEEFNEHIEQIRQSSDIQIIPYLVELLADETIEEEKKDAIYSLIMDVKHPESAKLLAKGVKYLKGKPELQPYLAALWQNSLSFADEFELFVELVLSEDYLAAYDAFTIIENSASDATAAAVESAITKLNKGLDSQCEEKKAMVTELINVLEDVKKLPQVE